MRPIDSLPYLTLHATFADAEDLLRRCSGAEWLIPVVDSKVGWSVGWMGCGIMWGCGDVGVCSMCGEHDTDHHYHHRPNPLKPQTQ